LDFLDTSVLLTNEFVQVKWLSLDWRFLHKVIALLVELIFFVDLIHGVLILREGLGCCKRVINLSHVWRRVQHCRAEIRSIFVRWVDEDIHGLHRVNSGHGVLTEFTFG
jgi:hypothetical protein